MKVVPWVDWCRIILYRRVLYRMVLRMDLLRQLCIFLRFHRNYAQNRKILHVRNDGVGAAALEMVWLLWCLEDVVLAMVQLVLLVLLAFDQRDFVQAFCHLVVLCQAFCVLHGRVYHHYDIDDCCGLLCFALYCALPYAISRRNVMHDDWWWFVVICVSWVMRVTCCFIQSLCSEA